MSSTINHLSSNKIYLQPEEHSRELDPREQKKEMVDDVAKDLFRYTAEEEISDSNNECSTTLSDELHFEQQSTSDVEEITNLIKQIGREPSAELIDTLVSKCSPTMMDDIALWIVSQYLCEEYFEGLPLSVLFDDLEDRGEVLSLLEIFDHPKFVYNPTPYLHLLQPLLKHVLFPFEISAYLFPPSECTYPPKLIEFIEQVITEASPQDDDNHFFEYLFEAAHNGNLTPLTNGDQAVVLWMGRLYQLMDGQAYIDFLFQSDWEFLKRPCKLVATKSEPKTRWQATVCITYEYRSKKKVTPASMRAFLQTGGLPLLRSIYDEAPEDEESDAADFSYFKEYWSDADKETLEVLKNALAMNSPAEIETLSLLVNADNFPELLHYLPPIQGELTEEIVSFLGDLLTAWPILEIPETRATYSSFASCTPWQQFALHHYFPSSFSRPEKASIPLESRLPFMVRSSERTNEPITLEMVEEVLATLEALPNETHLLSDGLQLLGKHQNLPSHLGQRLHQILENGFYNEFYELSPNNSCLSLTHLATLCCHSRALAQSITLNLTRAAEVACEACNELKQKQRLLTTLATLAKTIPQAFHSDTLLKLLKKLVEARFTKDELPHVLQVKRIIESHYGFSLDVQSTENIVTSLTHRSNRGRV